MTESAGNSRSEGGRAVAAVRVFRGVLRTLGRSVRLPALALSVALGIPAAILFSANGLRAQDIVALARRSLGARALLWAGWLALSAPVLAVLFDAPGSRTLRALRLPRAPLVSSLLVLAFVVELPWAVLFARGGGFVAAWAAITLAIAFAASSTTARRRSRWAGVVVLGSAFLLWGPTPWLGALCGSIWAPLALDAAWRCGLEQPRVAWRLSRPMPALLALYFGHLLRLVRAARSRLLVAIAACAAGSAGFVYSLRNDPTERPLARALAAMALPLTLAAAACTAPVIDSEARLRYLLRSLRVPRVVVLAAFLSAIATPSSALAASTGMVASTAGYPGSAALLGATLVIWAATLSAAVAFWGRLLESRGRRTAGTFAAGVTLIAALALLSAFSW